MMHETHEPPLVREIRVRVEGVDLDFEAASDLAKRVARRAGGEPLLLAWLDRDNDRAYPRVPECMHEAGWVDYAESRDAHLRIVVNEGAYVFLFCPGEEE